MTLSGSILPLKVSVVSVRPAPPNAHGGGLVVSTFGSGHCGVLFHGPASQAPALECRRKAFDLLSDAGSGGFGGAGRASVRDEREPDFQMVERPTLRARERAL